MLLRRYHKKPKETEEGTKDLEDLTVPKLKELAKEADVAGYSSMNKEELIKAIEDAE